MAELGASFLIFRIDISICFVFQAVYKLKLRKRSEINQTFISEDFLPYPPSKIRVSGIKPPCKISASLYYLYYLNLLKVIKKWFGQPRTVAKETMFELNALFKRKYPLTFCCLYSVHFPHPSHLSLEQTYTCLLPIYRAMFLVLVQKYQRNFVFNICIAETFNCMNSETMQKYRVVRCRFISRHQNWRKCPTKIANYFPGQYK